MENTTFRATYQNSPNAVPATKSSSPNSAPATKSDIAPPTKSATPTPPTIAPATKSDMWCCEMWCEMWVMWGMRVMWLICDVRCEWCGQMCDVNDVSDLARWVMGLMCDVRCEWCEWCVMWLMWAMRRDVAVLKLRNMEISQLNSLWWESGIEIWHLFST